MIVRLLQKQRTNPFVPNEGAKHAGTAKKHYNTQYLQLDLDVVGGDDNRRLAKSGERPAHEAPDQPVAPPAAVLKNLLVRLTPAAAVTVFAGILTIGEAVGSQCLTK